MENSWLARYTNQEFSQYTNTYLMGIPDLVFVFDRTQEDVDRVLELQKKYIDGTITDDEKKEWNDGIKGAINISDINRIEENIDAISSVISVKTVVKSWEMGNIPNASDYRRILSNVQKICEGWAVLPDTPEIPKQPLNTYQKWNDIEHILYDVYYLYNTTSAHLYYGGEISAGEGIGII